VAGSSRCCLLPQCSRDMCCSESLWRAQHIEGRTAYCELEVAFESARYPFRHVRYCEETRFLQRDGHQLAAGLHYCHVNHVIHRDIKPHNILVHLDTTTLKLADFGLARPSSHFRPLTPEVISLWYRPPELLMRSKDYDVSVDIWSFGCILSEMATGKAWPGISSLPFYAEIFPHRRVWLSKSSWPRRPTTSRTFSRRQL